MTIAEFLMTVTVVFTWITGIVFAQGFWLTTLAAIFPPYALYLTVEKIIGIAGLL